MTAPQFTTSVYVSPSTTTGSMAASSDRSPPPLSAAEEPEAGATDMADGDSDEGEDIFVSNVRVGPSPGGGGGGSMWSEGTRESEPGSPPLYLM